MREKPGVEHTRGCWAQTLSSGLEHRPYANADVCRADFQPWPCEVARLEVQVAQLRTVLSDCVVDGATVTADNAQLRAELAFLASLRTQIEAERDQLRAQLAHVKAWVTQHGRILDAQMIRHSIEVILADLHEAPVQEEP